MEFNNNDNNVNIDSNGEFHHSFRKEPREPKEPKQPNEPNGSNQSTSSNQSNGFNRSNGSNRSNGPQWSRQPKQPGKSYHNNKSNPDKLKKFIPLGVVFALIAIFGSDATFQIQEQEQAVVTTLGVPKAVTETGLHFKIPMIQDVHKVNTTIQGFTIGYDPATNTTVDSEGVMITSDYNFINVDFFVEYRIADPVKYLYNSEEPEAILKNVSQSCIRTVIASYKVDDVLTTGKGEIQAKIKDMILTKMDNQDVGIQLVNITIQDSEPPTQEVMKAFKAVETAKQGKETALNNANKYRNEKLPEAEAEADQVIQEAEAQKQVRINEAEGEVARFNAMYEEYIKNPTITKQRMFYEAMEDVLPGLKIVIDDGTGVEKILPIESFMSEAGVIDGE